MYTVKLEFLGKSLQQESTRLSIFMPENIEAFNVFQTFFASFKYIFGRFNEYVTTSRLTDRESQLCP